MEYSPTQYILGIKVNYALTMKGVLSIIENQFLTDGNKHYVCTTNPEFIMLAQTDPGFKKIINESDLSIPDGVGVVQALEYQQAVQNYKKDISFIAHALVKGLSIGITAIYSDKLLKKKIKGVELTEKMCALAEQKGYTVFLLGGRLRDKTGKHIIQDMDMAEIAAQKLKNKYPKLQIIGATSRFNRSAADDAITADYINSCMKQHGVEHIDFMFVAYEQAYQEKWIVRNRDKINVKVSVGIGSTLDYISESMKYSPKMFDRMNLEWLYKLIIQPWRFKRIVRAFPVFPIKVFFDSLK
ncbi:hypothetical protein A2415_02560 [candidate division WWE3 bacterium RIFOXYC1_FULL_39_7]|uniref:N-acetylglucosaminyldiphosphoundecaprenol N-acetyl-beta-D-mannosaminyltransferase n=1 Tax=candidate division WWE3 bacterium RIFOXYC1_FULL_39_7 TaxID=1802643 RepID=A0A1F4WLW9_UNCKA|nr:MAG: hypothetical protein A2415_02560 [candidate division WWE3 bacterium RIFOXYC1_FULL_39_7]